MPVASVWVFSVRCVMARENTSVMTGNSKQVVSAIITICKLVDNYLHFIIFSRLSNDWDLLNKFNYLFKYAAIIR